MEMDDELADFIREHKAKVAEDKASLEEEPPYMEIKAKPHRTYGSTVKENIPPKPFPQAKEESYNVGLPLGMEYERKKQRLRHELRMDYRQYVAQKNQSGESGPLIHNDNRRSMKKHLLEDQIGLFPSQCTPSLRDAATLTEDSKGLHRDLILTEAARLSPEEEGHSSLPLKRRDRLNKVSEDEDLEMTEGRYTRVDTSCEKRQPSKINGGKKENPVDVARAGRRLRTQINKEDRVFATGLIIGAADTVDALRRRKEHYRKELQAQIAEQYKNKKREKELELKFAATEANDPEKQPHRSRQFNRRKNLQVLELLAEIDSSSSSSSSSRAVHNNDNIRVEHREMPPPEHPNVAFQSPLLEYNSALGLAGGGSGLFPNRYPAVLNFSQSDTPRLPSFPPHPPPAVGEGFRSSNPDSHHYFGARHLIDPNMAYWGAVASHLDQHSQNSGSDFLEPQKQPNRESVTMDSHAGVFHLERTRSTRNRILDYRESLKQQIQEQQERKRLEREESERYEAQLEADMKNHQPWGRGGGGAPLRDSTGNLIADLSQMHKLNKEAYSNPEQWQRRAKVPVIASRAEHSDHTERVSGTVPDGSVHDRNDTVYGFTHVYAPQFARSNVFANQPTQQQLQEQDKYKAYLKEQIEEKMRKKAEERERIRLEEEKEEKRLAEQRARIQREYEEEQEKKKRKEMEQKAKNEELIQLAEQRKKEAERRKKEEEKESAALRRQYERERQVRLEEVHREPSPPIPTLQKKHGLHPRTPRPPTVDSHHSTVPMSECSVSGLQSPPVPGCRNQLRAAGDQRDVVSELSTLRRQLCIEQNRLEGRLQQDIWEVSDSPMSDRHRERPAVDVFDMARLRLQAPVRRPSSRNVEPRNLLRIHDSLHLKYAGAPKLEDVASKKWWDYRDLHNHVSSQRSTVQDDYFDLSPPHQHDERSVNVGYPRGSLLESESAFIDPLGDAFPVLHTSYPEKAPQLSARERRRLARQSQHPQEQAACSKYTGYHEISFTNTGNRLQLEVEPRGEGSSQDRPGHQRALSHCDNTAGPVDLSGDESSPSRFFLHNHNRPISQATVPTDAWIYPGTSETLTCSDRQSRMTT